MKDRSREGFVPLLMLGMIFVLVVCYVVERPDPLIGFGEETGKHKILLDHDRIVADHNDAYMVEGSRLTILKGGEFNLQGELEDGQIIVDVGPEENVTLKLNQVKLHSEDSAAIFVKAADSLTIKLKRNSENHISDGKVYGPVEEDALEPNGCICSKADLKIKGEEGTLIVEGNCKHGIVTSDDLKIKSGNVIVQAKHSALRGKDSVTVESGSLNLTGRDGIYSDGTVTLQQGKVTIDAREYGIFGQMGIMVSDACKPEILHAASPMAEPGRNGE